MAAIALEAHVTKPVLYQYVGNKDALVAALAERHMERINDAVARATGLTPNGRDRVRSFVAAFFDLVDAHPNLYLFLASSGGSERHVQHNTSFADQSARPLAIVLARQRVAVGADPAVATTWAYGMVGLLHHVTLWWLREPGVSLEQVVEHVTELLWTGLGGDAGDHLGRTGRNRSNRVRLDRSTTDQQADTGR
jgi:AcrR family transcriptional regulator